MRRLLLLIASLVSVPATSLADDLESVYGVWEQLGEACASSKAGMEGYYFEFRPGTYIPGGGTCENVKMALEANTLTVTAICFSEESEPAPMRSIFQLSGPYLIDEFGTKLERCSP